MAFYNIVINIIQISDDHWNILVLKVFNIVRSRRLKTVLKKDKTNISNFFLKIFLYLFYFNFDILK